MKTITTLFLLVFCIPVFSQELGYVKMKSYKKPIVQGEINGKKGYFLIDTGSDISIINSSELSRYKLESNKTYGDHRRAIGFNGETTAVMKIKNADVRIGDRFDHQTFYSLDIDQLVQSIEAKTYLKISGILGADVLMKYHCVIDYNQRRIILVDSRSKKHLAAK